MSPPGAGPLVRVGVVAMVLSLAACSQGSAPSGKAAEAATGKPAALAGAADGPGAVPSSPTAPGGRGAPPTPPTPAPTPPTPAPTPPTPAPSPPARAPSPPAAARPRPTAPAAPDPTPTPPAERPGTPTDVAVLAAEVAAVRGLDLLRPLDARALPGPELADKLASLAEDEGAETREARRRLLVALRLVPPDVDVETVVRELYSEQVIGLYVPAEITLYVAADAGSLTPYQQLTAAHEIAHALQDQHHDLERLRAGVEQDADAALALLALIEGDAVVTQQRWSAANQTSSDLRSVRAEAAARSAGALVRAPDAVMNAVLFPYREGVAFVQALIAEGGQGAVDAAFADPPTSTEQILDPVGYLARDAPVDVRVRTAPGPGWTDRGTEPLGAFDLRETFAALGDERAAAIATGWGGGQARTWHRGEEVAIAAVLAFDSPADATEACAGVPDWYRAVAGGSAGPGGDLLRGDRDVLSVRCEPTAVHLGLAPDAATAGRLAGSVGPPPAGSPRAES